MATTRNTNNINWKALKLTTADNQVHQLGRTIYRHIAAAKRYREHIVARCNGLVWICWKNSKGWNTAFVTDV